MQPGVDPQIMSHLILCSIGNFFAVLSRVPFIASAQQQAHVQTAKLGTRKNCSSAALIIGTIIIRRC
jgi:hypothetical protein